MSQARGESPWGHSLLAMGAGQSAKASVVEHYRRLFLAHSEAFSRGLMGPKPTSGSRRLAHINGSRVIRPVDVTATMTNSYRAASYAVYCITPILSAISSILTMVSSEARGGRLRIRRPWGSIRTSCG